LYTWTPLISTRIVLMRTLFINLEEVEEEEKEEAERNREEDS
jgi:hypothetical protein